MSIFTILQFIFMAAIIAAIIVAIYKFKDIFGSIGQNVKIAFTPATRVCKKGWTKRGEMCYEDCPPGWISDGTHTCYAPKPADWKGTATLTHLQHHTIWSSVGADTKKSFPNGCTDTKLEHHGNRCYKNPNPSKLDFKSLGFYGDKCKPGYRWIGVSCSRPIDITYDHTFPWIWGDPAFDYEPARKRCLNSPYGKKHGCTNLGCCIWRHKCESGRYWNGTGCVRPRDAHGLGSLTSVRGTPVNKCPEGRELGPLRKLCYPKCPPGYERTSGNQEKCTTICPPGFTNIGIGGCQKPAKWVKGMSVLKDEVGQCPDSHPVRKAALCYKECGDGLVKVDGVCEDINSTSYKIKKKFKDTISKITGK